MKPIITFFLFLICVLFIQELTAQTPESFNYQAIIRDQDGEVLKNQTIELNISFLVDTTTSNYIYQELHEVTTNSLGLVAITIGNGEVLSGSFQDLNWGNESYFLKVEFKLSSQTEYALMGYSALKSVPYALHAKTVQNNDDADADPANEIQTISYENDSLQISQANKIKLPIPDTTWRHNSNDLFFNTGNVGIGTEIPSSKLIVKADEVQDNELLFAVINSTNDTVFSVFESGVNILVDDNPEVKISGNRGGFAVGGFSSSKGFTNEFLRVTPDSVRIYVEDTHDEKISGNRGGFAVGGFSSSKTEATDFLYLTPENYFIGHQSGQANETGLYNSFFGYQTGMQNAYGSQNVFIGYKTGMLSVYAHDNIFIGNSAGLNSEFSDHNIFIGHYAGFSTSGGNENVFIGDSVGYNNHKGHNNIYLGKNAAKNNDGNSNVFLGAYSGLYTDSVNDCILMGWEAGMNIQGDQNICIGIKAGKGWDSGEEFTGTKNVFIGIESGFLNLTGSNNVFLGDQSGSGNFVGNENVCIGRQSGLNLNGNYNLFLGAYSGYFNDLGENNVYVGYKSGYNTTTGNNVFLGAFSGYNGDAGGNSIYLGFKAGYFNNEAERLFIENSDAEADSALIYGEFDNDKLNLNASVHIRDCLTLKPQDSPPEIFEIGTIYFDAIDNKIKYWNGSTWLSLLAE